MLPTLLVVRDKASLVTRSDGENLHGRGWEHVRQGASHRREVNPTGLGRDRVPRCMRGRMSLCCPDWNDHRGVDRGLFPAKEEFHLDDLDREAESSDSLPHRPKEGAPLVLHPTPVLKILWSRDSLHPAAARERIRLGSALGDILQQLRPLEVLAAAAIAARDREQLTHLRAARRAHHQL